MNLIVWHYSKGLIIYFKRVGYWGRWIVHFFGLRVLFQSLFSPWKMMIVEEESGFNFGKMFENMTFNMISVGVGFVVRMFLILISLICLIFWIPISILGLILWLLIPFLGWEYYLEEVNSVNNKIDNLKKNIRKDPKNGSVYIINSSLGKFLTERVGDEIKDDLQKIVIVDEDLVKLEAKNSEEMLDWWLGADNEVEKRLRGKNISVEDIKFLGKWWDKYENVREEKNNEKWKLGRPGIGAELIFGYTNKLNLYSENLSVIQTFWEHLIGREEVVERMEKIMASGKSVILKGKPGVGKMTVVHEFAYRAMMGDLGKEFEFAKLISLNYEQALAGSDDSDAKKVILHNLLKEAENAGNIILVLRDIYKLVNVDSLNGQYFDVLTKILEKKKLKIIGLTTDSDYERFLARDNRVFEYFETVEVEQVSKEKAYEIVMEHVYRLEKEKKVFFDLESLKQVVEGSDRYITDTPFPEKALELADEVSAFKYGLEIKVEDVNKIISEKTKITLTRLTESEKKKLINLEEIMHKSLIGQETTVELIAKSLRGRAVAVKSEERPVGSFLFLGPTGTGKTETAKVLAEVYFGDKKNIIRFDMAEYGGREGLERLIGSVDNKQSGALTTAIKNNPSSLLLLDEFEKATREVYNLFLTLLDEGYINDALGNKITCKHLFVIATSNAGSEYIRESVEQGIEGEDLQEKVLDHVQKERIFSPEFLNRFDGVVIFETLTKEELGKVAVLMLESFKENMLAKNMEIEFDESVAKKIVEDGYSADFGARTMRRIVDLNIADIIGRGIIEGKINPGDKIRLMAGEKKNEYLYEII